MRELIIILAIISASIRLAAEDGIRLFYLSPQTTTIGITGHPPNYLGLVQWQYSSDLKNWETRIEGIGEVPHLGIGFNQNLGGEQGFWRLMLAGDPAPESISGLYLSLENENRSSVGFIAFIDDSKAVVLESRKLWVVDYIGGKTDWRNFSIQFIGTAPDFPWFNASLQWSRSNRGGMTVFTKPNISTKEVLSFEYLENGEKVEL